MKIIKIYILFCFFLSLISCKKELERDNLYDENRIYNKKVNFYYYEVYSDYNGDKKINKGESISLKICLKNYGNEQFFGLKASITCNSPYILNLKNNNIQKYLMNGTSDYTLPDSVSFISNPDNYLTFDVSPSTPVGAKITFNLIMSDELGNKWADIFNISIENIGGIIKFYKDSIVNDNNGDGIVNKGENVSMKITLKNTGMSQVNNLKATITSNSPYITNLKNGDSQSYLMLGSLDYVSSGTLAFISNPDNYLSFDVSSTAPIGTNITFNITMTDDIGNIWTDSFNVTVEQIAADIKFHSFSVSNDDNGDGIINKGERITIKDTLLNVGSSRVNKLKVTISSSSPYISNITNEVNQAYFMLGTYEYILPSYRATRNDPNNYLTFDVSLTTPTGTIITFNVTMIDEFGNTWFDSFDITVFSLQKNGNGVTDINGNYYPSVIIGNQEWMAQNLSTTKYNDGNNIPNVISANEWANLTTGAWCAYNNINGTYGYLYNWHTVNTDMLCPTGWHVPSDKEWSNLTNYLASKSFSGIEGKVLKSKFGWYNNENGSDEFGFRGFPGGVRSNYGGFDFISEYGFFWSSDEDGADNAWGRLLDNENSILFRGNNSKLYGFSVRCIKD